MTRQDLLWRRDDNRTVLESDLVSRGRLTGIIIIEPIQITDMSWQTLKIPRRML